jgi:hypothetical protein
VIRDHLTEIVLLVLKVILGIWGAWGLPIASACARGWAWLYTLPTPRPLRLARRQELASDVWEQIDSERAKLYRPSEIAAHIAFRTITGVFSDIHWSLTHVFALRRIRESMLFYDIVRTATDALAHSYEIVHERWGLCSKCKSAGPAAWLLRAHCVLTISAMKFAARLTDEVLVRLHRKQLAYLALYENALATSTHLPSEERSRLETTVSTLRQSVLQTSGVLDEWQQREQ